MYSSEVSNLISELATELNRRGISIRWCLDGDMYQKFLYNTNIRHEGPMGEDLHLKTAHELLNEIVRCQPRSLVLLLHTAETGKSNTHMLFYTPE